MKTTLTALLLALLAGAALAGDVIDRIAAVVNEEIIPLSEIDEVLLMLEAEGQLQGMEQEKMDDVRRDILDRLIEQKLVVQRAKSQGITLQEAEVSEAADEALAKLKGRFPDEAGFRRALEERGITYNMLRDRYEEEIRQERLAQRITAKEVRSQVSVETDEVRRYFDTHRAEIPKKPSEVRLAHIVVQPISPERERAGAEAIEAAWRELGAGVPFEDVVRKNRGGRLGRFCKGDLDPGVESVLDTLAAGATSAPVRSLQGYHVFRMIGREETCWELEHVLVAVPLDPTDIDLARRRAERARERVVAGEAFEQVASEMSDDGESRSAGGDLGWTVMEGLVPAVTAAVESLPVGGPSGIVQTDRGFHVFRVLERRPGEEYAYDEIADRLRGLLEQQKLEEAYGKWLAAVRDSAYVEVKAWSR